MKSKVLFLIAGIVLGVSITYLMGCRYTVVPHKKAFSHGESIEVYARLDRWTGNVEEFEF